MSLHSLLIHQQVQWYLVRRSLKIIGWGKSRQHLFAQSQRWKRWDKKQLLYVIYFGRWANGVWQTTGMDGLTFIENNKHSKSQLFILINKLELPLIKINHKIVPWNDCAFLTNCYIKATFTKRGCHWTQKCYFRLLVKALTKINWNNNNIIDTCSFSPLFSIYYILTLRKKRQLILRQTRKGPNHFSGLCRIFIAKSKPNQNIPEARFC